MKFRDLFIVIGLLIVVVIGSWATTALRGKKPGEGMLPAIAQMPDFTLINQDGRPVTGKDLAGTPYILDFIFTSCTDFCPSMTREMGNIRKALGEQSRVRTVSVSVDPERDKPAVLKKYAGTNNKSGDDRWLFLTGEQKEISNVLLGLHLVSTRDVVNPDPSMHNQRFILVDAGGTVRGYYHYDDEQARERLVRDAKRLEAEK